MNKSQLRDRELFHLVDPSELESLEESVEYLESILHNPCTVMELKGELHLLEIKVLVATVRGLKIEIYPNEHAPPHFHVKSQNINASFTIEGCELLDGDISNSDIRKIKFWYNHSKNLLIERWNETRPSNCTVGFYRDN